MVQVHKIPENMKAFTQEFFKAPTYLGKTVIGKRVFRRFGFQQR